MKGERETEMMEKERKERDPGVFPAVTLYKQTQQYS